MSKLKINSYELIDVLSGLRNNCEYKPKKIPEFTIQEAGFIQDLIFSKPRGLVYLYLADHIQNQTPIGQLGMLNSIGYRRFCFLKCFLESRGNASRAAVAAGYSPRSARQQGHRILKEIQKYSTPVYN